MKHFFFSLLFLVSSVLLSAGEYDWYVSLAPKVLFNPDTRTIRYGGTIFLEKQISGRKAFEFGVTSMGTEDMGNLIKDSELLLLGYYKPVLSLGKNTHSNFKLGANIGVGDKGLLFGLGAGFEYNIVLRNRMQIVLSQDNLLVFRGEDRFTSGVSIGIKLPL